ncbi:YfhL family 4Fe-4S dicluster ferredoxin [Chloroflexota bacterium]
MAYKISDECISCGACETECPNGAISEGETIYVIDSDKCTECVGAADDSKCADICPVAACEPDPDKQESKEELQAKYDKLHS